MGCDDQGGGASAIIGGMARKPPGWWALIPPLHAQGLGDRDIADRLGRSKNAVYTARAQRLRLPTNVPLDSVVFTRRDTRPGCNRVVTAHRRRPTWYGQLHVLWAAGFNDGQIARELGRKVPTVSRARARYLRLPANTRPGGQHRQDEEE